MYGAPVCLPLGQLVAVGGKMRSRRVTQASPASSRRVRLRVWQPVVAGVAVLAFATTLDAHDFWVIPDAFSFADGATVSADGHSGTNFPGTPGGAAPAGIADARLVGASGETKITEIVQEGKALKLRQKPTSPGQYLIALTLQPRTTRSTGAGFRRYLALEGATDEATRLEHDASFPTTDSIAYRSTKYAGTIVEVGNGPRAFSKAPGFALEIIPMTDPARFVSSDTAQFRVLAGGHPVAGLRVHAGAADDSAMRAQQGRGGAGGSDPDQHPVSDAQGTIRVALTKGGRWNLRTAHAAPQSGTAGAWDVHWTTLVFGVSNGGKSGGDVADRSTLNARRATDSADVVGAVDRFHTALAIGDSAAALALLAPDALIVEGGDVQTRAEYRSHHLPADIAFAAAVPSKRSVSNVTVRGDAAWVTATSITQGDYRGRQLNSAGAELTVLTRTASGWQIRAVHWSSHARR